MIRHYRRFMPLFRYLNLGIALLAFGCAILIKYTLYQISPETLRMVTRCYFFCFLLAPAPFLLLLIGLERHDSTAANQWNTPYYKNMLIAFFLHTAAAILAWPIIMMST